MINVGINLRLPLLLPIRDLDMLDDDDDNDGNNGVTGHWVLRCHWCKLVCLLTMSSEDLQPTSHRDKTDKLTHGQ